jgi:hypothetical protein
MTDEPRLIEIGVLPRSGEIFFEGADPIAIMIRDADMRLAAERAAAEKTLASKAADIDRVKLTRRARAARSFRRALKTFARMQR